jgi:hypothetical protein
MYGIQLAGTVGFEVTGSVIRHNPVANKAGLGILSSSNGVVRNSTITGNSMNIYARNTKNVTIDGIAGCNDAFLYGFCKDRKSSVVLVERANATCVPVTECALPDTPW